MTVETFGDYQLLRKLATGGMAELYLARQFGVEGFEKYVVVKRILPHLAENEEFVRMFLDEARIASRLSHPNIVHIYNLGSEDNHYFIAMEYIHGDDVRRVWRTADSQSKRLTVPLICRIIMEAAAGLDYAHKRVDASGQALNIVHRDVSPQNIIVSFDGAVKIVDFGIAKAANQVSVTRTGILKGKYSYMSPEQAQGQRVDCRTDVFALGVVMYELLTGRRLFKRSNDIQTLQAVIDCQVPPPSVIEPSLPQTLDAIVLKALTKSTEARFRDANAFQRAIEQWLLDKKLPSATPQLAGFMQEVYKDRIEKDRAAFADYEALSQAENEAEASRPKMPRKKSGSTPSPAQGGDKRSTGLEHTMSLADSSPSEPLIESEKTPEIQAVATATEVVPSTIGTSALPEALRQKPVHSVMGKPLPKKTPVVQPMPTTPLSAGLSQYQLIAIVGFASALFGTFFGAVLMWVFNHK